jgi:hypothetical protein
MRAKTQTEVVEPMLDTPDHDLQHSQDLAALQTLLTRGRVEEARCLVKQLEARWPGSDLVRHFARVLAPPIARVVAGKKGITHDQSRKESAWLREHAHECDFPKLWLLRIFDTVGEFGKLSA